MRYKAIAVALAAGRGGNAAFHSRGVIGAAVVRMAVARERVR
jgi:hypothetical protein